jgi:hypothetical protein
MLSEEAPEGRDLVSMWQPLYSTVQWLLFLC